MLDDTNTTQPSAAKAAIPAPAAVNRNPLAPPEEGEATYQQLEDGTWYGILSLHRSHQHQVRGVTKEECQLKIKEYLNSEGE